MPGAVARVRRVAAVPVQSTGIGIVFAWGLSKSAWSYREFSPFVAEAMKQLGA